MVIEKCSIVCNCNAINKVADLVAMVLRKHTGWLTWLSMPDTCNVSRLIYANVRRCFSAAGDTVVTGQVSQLFTCRLFVLIIRQLLVMHNAVS